MRIRLLTTAAAIALFAATVAPNLALAAGEAPSSSSGAATGTSTSTGGSLSEPAGIDSNATTPSVYAPTSGAGSPPVSAGSAGTGSGSSGASGALGNSASPTLTPSSFSSGGSGTVGTGMNGTGYSATGSATPGSTVYPTPGMPGTVSMPLENATGGRATYDSTYIGAPYETSMGGTEHYRRTVDGTQAPFEGATRYDALAAEIRESAGDTRGMADRNGSGLLPEEAMDSPIKASGGASSY